MNFRMVVAIIGCSFLILSMKTSNPEAANIDDNTSSRSRFTFSMYETETSANESVSTESSTYTIITNTRDFVPTAGAQSKNNIGTDKKLKVIYDELIYIQDLYILPPVCTLGMVGNSFVAACLYAKRGTNSSFIYMFAFITCDILSLISDLFLPVATLLRKLESNNWQKVAANMHFWCRNFISYVFRDTAFNILCVLSAERLMAIKYPLKLKSSWTVKYPNIFLLFSFLIGAVSIFSVCLFTEIAEQFDADTNSTKYIRDYTKLFLSNVEMHNKIVIVLRFFAGPLQILFFCVMNVLIVHGIYQSKKQLLSMQITNNARLQDVNNLQIKLCKMFLVLCIMNILAFLPNSFTVILAKFFPGLGLKLKSYTILLWTHGGNFLRVINSASDFIVIILMSTEIRNDLKKKFKGLASTDHFSQVSDGSGRTLESTVQECNEQEEKRKVSRRKGKYKEKI